MNRSVKWFAPLACLLVLAAVSQANNVFVLPDGVQSQTIQVFGASPLASAGSFSGPQGRPIDTLASPGNPVNYWTFGDASNDSVVAVNQAISAIFRSGTSNAPARAAAVTPDGQYVLVAAGRLRVFDASGATELTLTAPEVGSDPTDIAVSPDSQYAFVLSTASQRVTRVDLSDFTAAGFINVGGQPTAVTVGPDGLVYVSTTNEIRVIDGTEMRELGSIPLNGVAAKLYFTPDGKTGIVINRTPVTNVTVWIIDMKTRSVVGTIPRLATGAQTITMDDRVLVVSNTTAALTSKQTQTLYKLSLPPNLTIAVYEFSGIGAPNGVRAAAVSNEYPPRSLFYVTSSGSTNTLNKVELSSNQRTETSSAIGAADRLAFARQPSEAVPTSFIQYNNEQSIPAAGTFQPIAIRALDETGRPVYNAEVEFSTTTEGVELGNPSTVTNMDGLAVTTIDRGEATGRITVTATIGTSLTATFALTVAGGGGGGGGGTQGGIAIVSGNGQLVPAQYLTSEPFTVIVRDTNGTPVQGASVTWTVVEGGGTLSNTIGNTDDKGIATATFIAPGLTSIAQSYLQSKIRATSQEASVDFFVTTFPLKDLNLNDVGQPLVELLKPSLEARNITARSGQTLDDAITLRITAGYGSFLGRGIPNVKISVRSTTDPLIVPDPNVSPVASCAPAPGGGEPLTDANGMVNCDLVVGGRPGAIPLFVYGGNFKGHQLSLTVQEPLPTVMEIASGNNQSGLPGAVLSQQLVAVVKTTSGQVLPNAPVTWTATNATITSSTSVSDANGRVTANITLGSTVGPATVRASSGTATVTFTLTVTARASSLVSISGNGQTAIVGQQFSAPLVVELRDANGGGVAGQPVNFQVTSGAGTLSAATGTTNAQGRASVNVTAGATAGGIAVAATYGSLPPVTFNLTARLAGPVLSVSSFVNGASGAPGVVPGSVARIVAPGLAPNVQNCVVPDSRFGALPLELAQVTVQFGPETAGSFAPLFYVCNQGGVESVAVQVPFELNPGTTAVTIRVSGGSSTIQGVPVLQVQPGIFETVGQNNLRYAVALRPNGTFVSPQNPARRGEIVTMFATGLGRVDPAAATNSIGIPGQRALERVIVGVNNEGVRVVSAEYTPYMIGLYSVAFEVPTNTAISNNAPLALAADVNGSLVFANGTSIAIASQ